MGVDEIEITAGHPDGEPRRKLYMSVDARREATLQTQYDEYLLVIRARGSNDASLKGFV